MACRELLKAGDDEGIQVWEVRRFPFPLPWLEPIDITELGQFHESYTYIILNTTEGKGEKPRSLDLD